MEWYRNLRIVLSTEDKLPFMEQPIHVLPVPPEGQANPLDVVTTHQAWVKAQKEIDGLMFMTMDPDIQKNLELLQIVQAMTQNLSVSLILVSLRKEYNSFVQNYNMHSTGKTVTELHAMLKLLEQTLPPKEAPPFAPKPKNPPTPKKDNPAKDAICHQCDEVGIFTIELYSFPSTSWVYDMGCGTHICITTQGLRGSRKLKPGALSLYVGDGHRAAVEAIGEFICVFLCVGEEKSNTARHSSIHDESTTPPKSFWDYALESAACILNMVPTKKVDKTPYEIWHGQAPKLSYLKVWGCEALVKRDTLTKPDKLEPRALKCIFVGYPKKTMGYSFYYPPENKVFVARNAEFFENSLINHEHLESTRTRRAPDHMCLYIDAEEHGLEELGEPTNYKAALLDPESNK
ncbi:zinc finger, CCHC-type containing protein [Tanacetum coccineum]